MASKPKEMAGKAALTRVSGGKPGAFTAIAVSVMVGVVAAVATYKLLRSGD